MYTVISRIFSLDIHCVIPGKREFPLLNRLTKLKPLYKLFVFLSLMCTVPHWQESPSQSSWEEEKRPHKGLLPRSQRLHPFAPGREGRSHDSHMRSHDPGNIVWHHMVEFKTALVSMFVLLAMCFGGLSVSEVTWHIMWDHMTLVWCHHRCLVPTFWTRQQSTLDRCREVDQWERYVL